MKSLRTRFFIPVFFLLTIYSYPDEPDKGETIIIPSTYGWYSDGYLNIPVRAWIFKLKEDSIARNGLISLLNLETDDVEGGDKQILSQRMRYFLADNRRSKNITIHMLGRDHPLPETEPSGHTNTIIKIETRQLQKRLNLREKIAILPGTDGSASFNGNLYIIKENGLSIISDIDDTIKISSVLDKEKLIDNTFRKKFIPVKGMPELYRVFEKQGASFHYLSGSPWQLYPSLNSFLDEERFPGGSMELKLFRIKDRSFIKFINADQFTYKVNAIEIIMKRFPKRKFILIGDSGEKDPEVYAEIASEYNGQVKYIFIRDIGLIDKDSERRNSILKKAGKTTIVFFKDPSELVSYTYNLN